MSKVFWAVCAWHPDVPERKQWARLMGSGATTGWTDEKSCRKLWSTPREALLGAAFGQLTAEGRAKLVKVTKRPKPKPALKVGDEVTVRCKVLALDTSKDTPFTIFVSLTTRDFRWWIRMEDLAR